jgi:hypothetical protein
VHHEADRTDDHRLFVLREEVAVVVDDDKGILKEKAQVVVGGREEGALCNKGIARMSPSHRVMLSISGSPQIH